MPRLLPGRGYACSQPTQSRPVPPPPPMQILQRGTALALRRIAALLVKPLGPCRPGSCFARASGREREIPSRRDTMRTDTSKRRDHTCYVLGRLSTIVLAGLLVAPSADAAVPRLRRMVVVGDSVLAGFSSGGFVAHGNGGQVD